MKQYALPIRGFNDGVVLFLVTVRVGLVTCFCWSGASLLLTWGFFNLRTALELLSWVSCVFSIVAWHLSFSCECDLFFLLVHSFRSFLGSTKYLLFQCKASNLLWVLTRTPTLLLFSLFFVSTMHVLIGLERRYYAFHVLGGNIGALLRCLVSIGRGFRVL